jgi:hypothetical protein
MNSQVYNSRLKVSITLFCHCSVIACMSYFLHFILSAAMRVSTRALRYADDMELLAAADAATLVATVAILANAGGSGSASSRTWTSGGRSCHARKRRSIHDIYEQLDPLHFRRAFKMKFSSLANELRPYILRAAGHKAGDRIRHAPNGRILPDVRLTCAIRWFSGGSPYDMMTTFAQPLLICRVRCQQTSQIY